MIEALANRFKWAPDFWRALGWRELQAWIRQSNESARREARQGQTSEDSWAQRDADGWWDAQHEKARGR